MQITEEKITEIKNAADIVGVISESVVLKNAGKDFVGLCPFHDEKTPSFSVSQGKQIYFCFGCGAGGDVFQFLIKNSGISFLEAAKQLAARYSISLPENVGAPANHSGTPRPPGMVRGQRSEVGSQKSEAISHPPELWQEKAGKFAAWAHEKLLADPEQLKILAARGITLDTVKYFRLGWNPGKDGKDLFRPRESWGLETEMKGDRKKKLWLPIGLIIPMFSGDQVYRLRIRRPDDCDPPPYYVISGSSMATWIMEKSKRVYIIVESELDGVLLWQEARDEIGIIPLGSSTSRPDPAAVKLLKESALILNALDYDKAGAKNLLWWNDAFSQSKRWPVPAGKDPGDAWKVGIDLKKWITSGFPPGWLVGQSFLGSKKMTEGVPEGNKNEKDAGKDGRSMLRVGEGEKVQPQSATGSLLVDLRPALVPEVYKLEKLLKQYPVSIYNTPKRTSLRQPRIWAGKNWKILREITNLVYFSPAVFTYICKNPAENITGDNFIY